VPSEVSVLQPPHHLELHSSANSVGQIRLGLARIPPRLPDSRFFGETGAPCHCEEVQPARRKIPAFNKEQTECQPPPTIEPAAPVKGPDIIDHLKSSERLMTARELASILAISPKTIYSYAERNMIPHFKIEASVRFRGRDVAEWLNKHASLRRMKR